MATTLPSIETLMPYGWTNEENQEYLARRPVPLGFRIDPGSSTAACADEWDRWLNARAVRMADFLWPIWAPGTGWIGAAARHSVELTRVDLALIAKLRPQMAERIADDATKPTARHREAFREEDEGAPGKTLVYYTRAFPEALKAELNTWIVAGGIDIARPASQGLKKLFMRPRPQQVAMQANMPIVVERSSSAITPAMISGHCIQGTLALASVEAGLDGWLAAFPAVRDVLRRFLVDTGDRRVLAGLHYPSDNIGSWYTALCLCAHVWGREKGAALRQALWQSIQDHSRVLRAVKDAAASGEGKVYVPILERLNRAAADGDPLPSE